MPSPDDEFLKKLQATFKVEAEEHLQAISSMLLELEKLAPPQQLVAIENIFREAHSLKGAARAVDLADVEAICQALESVFSGWKQRQASGPPESFDTLHRAVDMIRALVAAPEMGKNRGKQKQRDDLIRQLGKMELRSSPASRRRVAPPSVPAEPVIVNDPPAIPVLVTPPPVMAQQPVVVPTAESVPVPPPPVDSDRTTVPDTVRISIAKLDASLLQAEDMLSVKAMAAQRAVELREVTTRFDGWRKQWARVSTDARSLRQTPQRRARSGLAGNSPRASAALADFLDWNCEYIRSLEDKMAALAAQAEQDHHGVALRVDDLLEESKKLLLLPFSTLTGLFPKVVRDISRDQGKEIDFVIQGAEVEIDKRILEEMKDALVHILRNCVDHGVEKPADREKAGKPARASITLSVSQVNGNKVEILVSDDGAGINVARVKDSAVRHGILAEAAARALGDAEAMSLIFHSGVSSSPIITEISGRGLGMAIVRAKAEKLGGHVSLQSKPGAGTTLRIVLPMTMATFRGILISAGNQLFVVPTLNVDRVLRVNPNEIQTAENREILNLQGHPMSVARLDAVLQLPPSPNRDVSAPLSVVVLHSADRRIAFVVDEVLHEEEVLTKPLGMPLVRVRNIAGAAVLGSGKPVAILNVGDLINSARRQSAATSRPASDANQKEAAKRVLVVEDSITSRMLLKGILESAGYEVETAVDGMDGFTTLREKRFDLVVSDVEMPRMNGFDLAARIRSDKRLTDMPVILVTALESREQRERGIDAGANAYITKSSFDQSNLLDVISKLI